MGLLYMKDQEHMNWIKYMAESAKLLGQEALLYQIDTIHNDLQNDPIAKYKEPVRINFLLAENPKPILKNFNWFAEDSELPYIGYFVILDDKGEEVVVDKDCQVEIITSVVNTSDRKFIISDIRGNKLVPLFWICKLTPYRPPIHREQVRDPEAPSGNTDIGYKYIQRKASDGVQGIKQ